MQTRFSFAGSCLCFIACVSDVAGPESTADDVAARGKPLRALSPDESYAGKTREDWAVEYTRWSNSQTSCDSPVDDDDGSLCQLYQTDSDSPVFYFERSTYTIGESAIASRTRCRVPAGKAILVPVAGVYIDNAGEEEAMPNEELRDLAAKIKDSMRNMTLWADGREVRDLEPYGIDPIEFDYRVPPAPNVFSCSEDKDVSDRIIAPSFLTGYFVMFSPPAMGLHEIEYGSVFTHLTARFSMHVKSSFVVGRSDD